MKYLFTILLAINSCFLFAQERVEIIRNESTAFFFDESDPYSLVSLLQLNSSFLSDYDLEGINPEDFKKLTATEKEACSKFVGPPGQLPLIDEDPNSPNFGYEIVRVDPETGFEEFVYPAPDTLYTSFKGINKIYLELREGEGEPFDRISKIDFYKSYSTGTLKVLSLTITDIKWLQDINYVSRLDKDLEAKITKGNPSFWSVLRDTCVARMDWYKEHSENGIFRGFGSNDATSFFPVTFYGSTTFIEYSESDPEDEAEHYYMYEDPDDFLPLSKKLCQRFKEEPATAKEVLLERFSVVHSIQTQRPDPLFEEDPDSPYFGDYKIEIVDGKEQFVYPDPETEVFFIEYDPVVYVDQYIEIDSTGKYWVVPEGLIFCDASGSGKPEIINYFKFEFDDTYVYRSFFKGYLPPMEAKALSADLHLNKLVQLINDPKHLNEIPFLESEVPCEPCLNDVRNKKKRKYALCWKGNPVTAYEYDTITRISDYFYIGEGFQALKGRELVLLDDKARFIGSGMVDWFYPVYDHPGVYIGQNGDEWMVVSQDSSYYLPLTKIPNGEAFFYLDGGSYANLDGLEVVIEKDGKKGLVNMKNETIIPPIYSEMRAAHTGTYALDDSYETYSTYMVKKEPTDPWTLLDADFKPIKTFDEGEYVGVKNVLLFEKDGFIKPIDAESGKIDEDYFKSDYTVWVQGVHGKGHVDTTGKIIVPLKYNQLNTHIIGDELYYFGGLLHGTDIYSKSGELLDSNEYQLLSLSLCNFRFGYFQFGSYRKRGVVHFNRETKKLEVVFEPQFDYISCKQWDSEIFEAIGTKGEEKYLLKGDGTMVISE